MGAESYVTAIGKFSKLVQDVLNYPADWYDDVPEGTPVITDLLACRTDASSHRLAEALGVDFNDFKTHKFDPEFVSASVLMEMAADGAFDSSDVTSFARLWTAGFEFYFRPAC